MQSMKAKFSLAIFPSQFVFYSYNQYCIVVYDGFLISKQSFASQTFVVCNSGTVLCYIYTQQLSVSHCTYFHTHVVPLCLSHYCIHRSLQPVKVRIVNLQVTATVPYQLFPLTPTPSLPPSLLLHPTSTRVRSTIQTELDGARQRVVPKSIQWNLQTRDTLGAVPCREVVPISEVK